MDMSIQLHNPGRFTPGKILVVHLIGDWMSPRNGLDVLEKWKSFTSAGIRTADP